MLQIKKITNKVWLHVDTTDGEFILSKFYLKNEFDKARVVEVYGSKRREYAINEIEVYDIGGGAETFGTFTALFTRLEALNYTGFYTDGEIVPSSLISVDALNMVVTGSDGKLKVLDAPNDGNEYVRKNNIWQVSTGGAGGKKSIIIEIPISQTIAASTSWYTRNSITQNIFNATFTASASLTPSNDFGDHVAQTPCNVVPFACTVKSVYMRGNTNSAPTDIRVAIVKSDRMTSNQATIVNPDIIADKTFATNSPVANIWSAIFSGADLDTSVTIPQGGEIRLLLFNNNVASNLYTTVCVIELEEI